MTVVMKGSGFKQRAERAAADRDLESKFRMVAQRHGALRKWRLGQLGNFEELRGRMNAIKERVLSDHDGCLDMLRDRIEAGGGTVHLAADAEAAQKIIAGIAGEANAKIAVKSKSMTSEEAGITPALEAIGMEVLETDLGEYIIQLAGERPSHIVTPAIHKSKEDIALLFHQKLGMEMTDSPELLTLKARQVLREKFLAADMGITGANALVAENGMVVLVENEGNIRLTTTLPKIHVALVGIEKLVPSIEDLAVLIKLLPRNATGQKMSGYLSMIMGARKENERDGAKEFHLVLLDNGRSKMRSDPLLREALKCVRCGACLNACPVYQHIGGHAYGSVYPGPIGAMVTHTLACGDADSWMLPFASSLCGACTEACPAKIPIHHILVEMRRRWAEGEGARISAAERAIFRAWSELWKRPSTYALSAKTGAGAARLISTRGTIKNLPPPGSAWTMERDFPAPPAMMFRERWEEIKAGLPKAEKEGPVAAPEISEGGEKANKEGSDMPLPTEPRPGNPATFAAECSFMKGEVIRARGTTEAKERLAEVLARHSGKSMVRWDHPDLDEMDLEGIARAAGVELLIPGEGELVDAAAKADVGVTAADYALADSGTLVLFTRPGQERSISLLPPAHLALLREDRVLADIDDLIAVISRIEHFRGLTLITGPSLTGDIEMIPVFGVHGPGKLTAILWSP